MSFTIRIPKARRVLTADPPWPFADQLPGGGRGSDKHYENSDGKMTLDDIMKMDIPLMLPSSILFLWRTGAHAGAAEEVAKAWGFVPKSEMIWRKWRVCSECAGEGNGPIATSQRSGGRGQIQPPGYCHKCRGHRLTLGGPSVVPHTGMGHYVQYTHEACLIATKKKGLMPARRSTQVNLSVFDALVPLIPDTRRVKHSAKPPEFYQRVERMYEGPYVELFARERRKGWLCLGDEVPRAA